MEPFDLVGKIQEGFMTFVQAGGVPWVSRWCPGGVPVVSQSGLGGVPVVSRWCPGGFPVVSQWGLGGVPVVSPDPQDRSDSKSSGFPRERGQATI